MKLKLYADKAGASTLFTVRLMYRIWYTELWWTPGSNHGPAEGRKASGSKRSSTELRRVESRFGNGLRACLPAR